LSEAQLAVLLICNVALTIPARIIVGALVDRFGPRRVYTWLLVAASLPCIGCALANEYWQLVVCRLLVSCIGAGFVVGIRLVGEWFDASEIGLAEGVYGGLGNFGMAAATFGLPLLAGLFGGENGWRWAMIVSGVACVVYAVRLPSPGSRRPGGGHIPQAQGEGCARSLHTRRPPVARVHADPMIASLGVLVWRLEKVGLLPAVAGYAIYVGLAGVLAWQMRKIVRANGAAMRNQEVPDDERYAFSQVAILALCYAVTFGGELASRACCRRISRRCSASRWRWPGRWARASPSRASSQDHSAGCSATGLAAGRS
jgi:NNP family nitrate/nitrite transporter-like MFS transporter